MTIQAPNVVSATRERSQKHHTVRCADGEMRFHPASVNFVTDTLPADRCWFVYALPALSTPHTADLEVCV